MEDQNNSKKKGISGWWPILLVLILSGYYKYTQIQKNIAKAEAPPPTLMIDHEMQQSIDAIVKDLGSIGALLTETSTVNELREKSEPIITALELKYKGNTLAEPSIQAAKNQVLDEIEKRAINEEK